MTEEEIAEQAKKLIQRFDKTRIIGAGGEWSGSTRQGFMFNPKPRGPSAEAPIVSGACCYCDGTCLEVSQSVCESGGGTYQGDGTACSPELCPTTTGACCIGEDCSVITEDCCTNAGGTYQGDDTTCDPNPCTTPTGACCVGEVCTIETEEDCTGMGGTYQGDDTTCDPNPCEMVDCTCGFDGFIDPSTRFLTMTQHVVGHDYVFDPFPNCTLDYDLMNTRHYNPSDCSVTDIWSGHASWATDFDSTECDFLGIVGGLAMWSCTGGFSGPPACDVLCAFNSACFFEHCGTPTSNITSFCSYSTSGTGSDCYEENTCVLSDECNPV